MSPPRQITADALRLALTTHASPPAALEAMGITRQAVYRRPDLRAVMMAHQADRAIHRTPRNAAGQLGTRTLALAPEVSAALNAGKAARVGRSRAAVARAWLAAEMAHAAPEPEPAGGAPKVCLDLGAVWDDVTRYAGTADGQATAGIVRALLRQAAKRAGIEGV